MTEEQAKTKWCPMIRAGTHGANYHVAGNWRGDQITDVDEREYTRCQGSACMMWRWTPELQNIGASIGESFLINRVPKEPSEGHCGLAGTPGMVQT